MTSLPSHSDVPPWLYKLFTGHQYPYVRRQAKFDRKDRQEDGERFEPTQDDIREKFWEIFPRCSTKMLQEVKVGMIVAFKELGGYEAGTYQEFIDDPENFLSRKYGKKKIKVNFYDGDNFVCTINFKVAGWTSHDDD
ncbi:hypothetical protein ACTRXD_19470 [Nitrospira sp. T9]|uniref:hypothetical protein n=1 Tax=unclassified Nitrospira TaxID=2652172 RepID=UPI003F9A9908